MLAIFRVRMIDMQNYREETTLRLCCRRAPQTRLLCRDVRTPAASPFIHSLADVYPAQRDLDFSIHVILMGRRPA